MTHITCRLTAKNRDQLLNPRLGDRVWATFTFTFYRPQSSSPSAVVCYCCGVAAKCFCRRSTSSRRSTLCSKSPARSRSLWRGTSTTLPNSSRARTERCVIARFLPVVYLPVLTCTYLYLLTCRHDRLSHEAPYAETAQRRSNALVVECSIFIARFFRYSTNICRIHTSTIKYKYKLRPKLRRWDWTQTFGLGNESVPIQLAHGRFQCLNINIFFK